MVFADRREAGRRLADTLAPYQGREDLLVLGLPRGGVPVAFEVARFLAAPLDVLVVRKLGLPGQRELAMGAIASGDIRVINPDLANRFDLSDELIEAAAQVERKEIERQERLFRGPRQPPVIDQRTVILADDGLATGSTMRAAVLAVRQHRPRAVIVAVPVGASETCAELAKIADSVVCVIQAEEFYAVGAWYRDFTATADEEVISLLSEAAAWTIERS